MLLVGLVMALLVIMTIIPPALAHEGENVADGVFTLNFGWRIEPTYTGIFNGPELTIQRTETMEPVTGAADTLLIEVTFGGQSKMLRLRETEEPGHYTADLIPTRPGDYSFRVYGTVEDLPIEETFNSADGGFNTVNPIEDIQFP
jgi:hypothetical protein